ncbi:MAG: calcium-binding protein, partial [Pseudomonadota bacterium]
EIYGREGVDILFGLAGDDTLSGGDGNDGLSGGAGNDVLQGDDGADVLDGGDGTDSLSGGAGNDVLQGAGGADVLDGGDGIDTAAYSSAGAGVSVDLTDTSNNTNDALGDTYISVENILGSNFDDVLKGDAGDNSIDGAGGADVLDGGDGIDTADYSSAGEGVYVDLIATGNNTNDALGDTYVSIENILGSSFDDVLKGDAGENSIDGAGGSDTIVGRVGDDTLLGGDGNDRLSAAAGDDSLDGGSGNDVLIGGAGADTLNGGDGNDTADYSTAASGVDVDFLFFDTTGNSGEAEGDVYTSVENLTGSLHADDLRGDGNGNVIRGRQGNDYINGKQGDDRINGGKGDDTLIGGGGADLFILKNDTGSDRISGFKLTGSSADKIDVSAFNFASYSALEVEFSTQGTDTLISLDDTNGDSVLLLDIALADLGQEHFIL